MGCEQSKPDDVVSALPQDPKLPRASGSQGRSAGIGGTERLISAQLRRQNDQLQASNRSSNSRSATFEVEEDTTGPKSPPKLNADGTLSAEEVAKRSSGSIAIATAKLGNKEKGGTPLTVQYAFTKRRGYYPDNPHKANQDDMTITLNLAGEPGDAVFCVFDGHGDEGHHCAEFSKKKLPQILAKHIRQQRVKAYSESLKKAGKPVKQTWDPSKWPYLPPKEFEECCKRSFLETNQAMHKDKTINDRLSGTTAVVAAFHGGRMTVCNVGDSRIVLGSVVEETNGKSSEKDTAEEEKTEVGEELSSPSKPTGPVVATPLSVDQTPFRKDERERVKAAGAEVKTIDMVEGRAEYHDDWGDFTLGEHIDERGDPPRVWIKGKAHPGTAFTRSLGDQLGEDIGICAEPEMETRHITKNDKYLVIASDGVFEFLPNQVVINLCESAANPLQACEIITEAAYEKWLHYERRTDDITVIVCFLDSNYDPKEDTKEQS